MSSPEVGSKRSLDEVETTEKETSQSEVQKSEEQKEKMVEKVQVTKQKQATKQPPKKKRRKNKPKVPAARMLNKLDIQTTSKIYISAPWFFSLSSNKN